MFVYYYYVEKFILIIFKHNFKSYFIPTDNFNKECTVQYHGGNSGIVIFILGSRHKPTAPFFDSFKR